MRAPLTKVRRSSGKKASGNGGHTCGTMRSATASKAPRGNLPSDCDPTPLKTPSSTTGLQTACLCCPLHAIAKVDVSKCSVDLTVVSESVTHPVTVTDSLTVTHVTVSATAKAAKCVPVWESHKSLRVSDRVMQLHIFDTRILFRSDSVMSLWLQCGIAARLKSLVTRG